MAWLLTWLVHGLAIALVARFALRALPGLSAATRYAMWWAALVLVLILPIVRGLSIGAERGTQMSAASGASSSSSQGDLGTPAPAPAAAPALPALLQSFSLPPVSLPRVPDWLMSIVIGLWLGCVMVGLAQLAYSVQAVRRLKSSCRRMVLPRESDLPMWSAVRDRGRAVRVRTSDCVRTAAVLGLTRPVIAVPRDAAAALTAHEIDQVVLHEYAHVQRYDDWTKLLQVLIGAFAGWHPAVRLMMREIDFEREAACDDYVVDVTGAPRAYARCLTKVIETMPGSSLDLAAVPHAFSSASHATTRIERLLDRKRPSGRLAVMPAMAGSATLAVLAFCTVHALPIATDLPRIHESAAMARGANAVVGTVVEGVDANDGNVGDDGSDGGAADSANGDARRENAASPEATRGPALRIAAASTLPIELPFSRFSPLSRLTNAQPAASRVTPAPAPGAPASPPVGTSLAPSAPSGPSAPSATGHASAVTHAPTAAPASAVEMRQAREVSASNGDASAAPASGAQAPAAVASHRFARDSRSGSGAGAGARRPASTSDMRDLRDAHTAPHRTDTAFALGPVVAAGDSNAMPAASYAGHIERAWENTRDATSKVVGVSARAVGSATRTAGDATKSATKTATNKAAAGVKAGGTHTARALGRVKRTLASVF